MGVEEVDLNSPLLNFQPLVRFTYSAPGGQLSPPGPGFWPQIVFRNKNS